MRAVLRRCFVHELVHFDMFVGVGLMLCQLIFWMRDGRVLVTVFSSRRNVGPTTNTSLIYSLCARLPSINTTGLPCSLIWTEFWPQFPNTSFGTSDHSRWCLVWAVGPESLIFVAWWCFIARSRASLSQLRRGKDSSVFRLVSRLSSVRHGGLTGWCKLTSRMAPVNVVLSQSVSK